MHSVQIVPRQKNRVITHSAFILHECGLFTSQGGRQSRPLRGSDTNYTCFYCARGTDGKRERKGEKKKNLLHVQLRSFPAMLSNCQTGEMAKLLHLTIKFTLRGWAGRHQKKHSCPDTTRSPSSNKMQRAFQSDLLWELPMRGREGRGWGC